MEVTDLLGYVGALLIGLVLGLIGGGGSILTVPILVYLLLVNPVLATAYSLFVVGVTAAVGTLRNIPKKIIDWRTAIVFSIPAFIAVYIARKFIVPGIPEELFYVGETVITKDLAIMVFFAVVMLLASISMIRKKKERKVAEGDQKFNYPIIILEGMGVGMVTGIVGAGGGFLIIPALVILANLPMKKAVATSLLIIAVKSLIGFIGDVENLTIDWRFLLSFTGLSVIGIFMGIYLNQFIDGKKLKKAFGWFVLVMGIYILYKEIVA
ncbi:MAG: sulfite exporter TauE/SafE family protein [Flavobacteriales bacterium]|nr:sulfite exporter TauE/SafE family protein [Flavobacteriales bacterium]